MLPFRILVINNTFFLRMWVMSRSLQKHLFIPLACLKRHSEQNLEVENFIKLFKLASQTVSFPMVFHTGTSLYFAQIPINSSILLALPVCFPDPWRWVVPDSATPAPGQAHPSPRDFFGISLERHSLRLKRQPFASDDSDYQLASVCVIFLLNIQLRARMWLLNF